MSSVKASRLNWNPRPVDPTQAFENSHSGNGKTSNLFCKSKGRMSNMHWCKWSSSCLQQKEVKFTWGLVQWLAYLGPLLMECWNATSNSAKCQGASFLIWAIVLRFSECEQLCLFPFRDVVQWCPVTIQSIQSILQLQGSEIFLQWICQRSLSLRFSSASNKGGPDLSASGWPHLGSFYSCTKGACKNANCPYKPNAVYISFNFDACFHRFIVTWCFGSWHLAASAVSLEELLHPGISKILVSPLAHCAQATTRIRSPPVLPL